MNRGQDDFKNQYRITEPIFVASSCTYSFLLVKMPHMSIDKHHDFAYTIPLTTTQRAIVVIDKEKLWSIYNDNRIYSL